jgi:hypothetical protein
MENIPRHGRAFFVSNHRGFIPIDAVMHRQPYGRQRGGSCAFSSPGLLQPPFPPIFFTKLGGVIASSATRLQLFEQRTSSIFPRRDSRHSRVYRTLTSCGISPRALL